MAALARARTFRQAMREQRTHAPTHRPPALQLAHCLKPELLP